ncbi:MAG: PAS domain S-box protein [Fuerstiella sp.]
MKRCAGKESQMPPTPTHSPDRPRGQTEERLRLLLNSAAEGIYALDTGGRCTFCNAACLRLLGYRHDEDLLGRNMHALIHHTRKDGSAYPVSECHICEAFRMQTEAHVDDEVLWRSDGSSFEAEYWSYPIREDGRVTGSVVTFLDITARKRVETKLKANEERFRGVLRNSPVPTLIYAEDGEILEVSQSLLDMTGYDREELRDIRDWTERAFGERENRCHAGIGSLIEHDGRHHEGEFVVTTRGGDRRVWDFWTASLSPLEDGRRLVVSKAMDVTDRNRNAIALSRMEQQSRQVIESLPQMVWTCQPDGVCDYLSPRWVEYTGVPLAEHLASGWTQAIHPGDRERAVSSWMDAVFNDQPYDIEYRIRRADGAYRWFRALGQPLRGDDGRIVKWFGTCTDIEDRKRHSEEIDRLNATLQQRVDEQTFELRKALRKIQSDAHRLHALNDAALAMQSARNLRQLIQIVTDEAREMIPVHQAVTTLSADQDWTRVTTATSLSDKCAEAHSSDTLLNSSGLDALVCETNRPLNLTQQELEAHPRWQSIAEERDNRPPIRGWLAVPLVGLQDRNIGSIQLFNRCEGDFTANDEMSLVQLSRLAAAAIEHMRLYEETADANRKLASANRKLDADHRLIEAIHQAETTFISEDSTDVFETMLDNLLKLTESEYGFIDEMFYTAENEPYLIARAITDISWSEDTRKLYDRFIAGEVAFANSNSLYGEVMVSGRPLIANDAPDDPRACGTPAGHPPLKTFLGLPLISSQRIVGMIGLANREGGYDDALVSFLKPMLSACGNLLAAWRNEQHRREAEEQLRQVNSQLAAQSEQLKAANRELESFSYSVSHDLRAPLRSVDSFSRIILEDYGPQLDQEGHRLLNIVRDEAQRMGQLIDDLLQFSRMGRQLLEPGNVNMTALARSAYEELPSQIKQHVQTIELPSLPGARGDRAMLRQVWTNLLSNAAKFTSHNPDAHIEVGSSVSENFHTYYVRDNGVGFDPRFTHKLFGVFQRLHAEDEFEGTGVGLAIVQRVIHRHEGKVWAEGSLDGGATFHFSLPKPKESQNG